MAHKETADQAILVKETAECSFRGAELDVVVADRRISHIKSALWLIVAAKTKRDVAKYRNRTKKTKRTKKIH